MSIPLPLLKPKATPSAVQGRMTVVAEDGVSVGQWGGTECYLSRENGLGPCLVLTTVSNKKRCTYFPLVRLHRVLSYHVSAGKLTVMMPHEQRRMVSIFIKTTSDVEELKLMAAVLQDKRMWPQIERNVSKQGKSALRGSSSTEFAGATIQTATPSPEVALSSGLYGDGDAYDPNDGDDGDEFEEEARNAAVVSMLTAAKAQRQAELDLPALADLMERAEKDNGASLAEAALGFHADAVSDGGDRHTSAATTDEKVHQMTSSSELFSSKGGSVNALLHGCPQFTLVADAIAQGSNVFITGPPGTGKTTFLLYLLQSLRRRDHAGGLSDGSSLDALSEKVMAVTAATGHAARFLGGTTLAAFSGVPANGGSAHGVDSLVERILTHRSLRTVLHNWLHTELLIIDDINEVPAHVFTLVSEVGRRVRLAAFEDGTLPEPATDVAVSEGSGRDRREKQRLRLDSPFGGLQVVVLGDFLAFPPPPSRAGEEVRPACASPTWRQCALQCVWLTPDRVNTKQQLPEATACLARYQTFLEDVREGEYTVTVDDVIVAATSNYRDRYFADWEGKHRSSQQVVKRHLGTNVLEPVMVVAAAKEAEEVNARLLAEALEGQQRSGSGRNAKENGAGEAKHAAALSCHQFTSEDYAAVPGTDLDSEINLPSSLTLCVGAQVMLLSSAAGFRKTVSGGKGDTHSDAAVKQKDEASQSADSASASVPLPFCPSYGSVGVVVAFCGSATDGRRNASRSVSTFAARGDEEISPVVRFFPSQCCPGSSAGSGAENGPRGDAAYVDIVVDKVAMQVYQRADAREGRDDERRKLLLSRTQLPLRLAFALPLSALRDTPCLPAVQLRADALFFSYSTSTVATHSKKAGREAQNEADGEAGNAEEGLLENQWGSLFAALCKVATADRLYLERFDRRLLKKAVSTEAKAFYRALCPSPTDEEVQARDKKRAAEAAILDQRRKARKAEKKRQKQTGLLQEAGGRPDAHSTSSGTKRSRTQVDSEAEDEAGDLACLTTPMPSQQNDRTLARRRAAPAAAAEADSRSPSQDTKPIAAVPALSDKAHVESRVVAAGVGQAVELEEEEGDPVGGSIADDSLRMPMLTQDSAVSGGVADLLNVSQVRAMVRGLLMDDDSVE